MAHRAIPTNRAHGKVQLLAFWSPQGADKGTSLWHRQPREVQLGPESGPHTAVDLAASVTSTNHKAHTSEVELDRPGKLCEAGHAGWWSEVEALRKEITITEKH